MLDKLIAMIRSAGAAIMQHGVRVPAAVVSNIVENHKGVRRLLVVWAAALISWVSWMVFKNPKTITTDEAVAYATNVGILATVLGLYQLGRGREERGGSQ